MTKIAKKSKRKVALGIVFAMLICSLSMVGGLSEPRHKVKAATSGTWELVKTNYTVADTWESGKTKITYSYEGIVDENVQFKIPNTDITLTRNDEVLTKEYLTQSQNKS